MKKTSVFDCSILDLKRNQDLNGKISIVESNKNLPFDIERIYYLYDVPNNQARGAHAHKKLYQLIIAASGSFTITLDDGNNRRSFMLNNPNKGLLILPGIWRELFDFSSGSVCLVLASRIYEADDYIRDYDLFLKFKK